MNNQTHMTRDGDLIEITDMTDRHLLNTIRMIERKAVTGLTISRGGFSIDSDEPWYDEDVLYNEEAKEHMNYYSYVDEAERRDLL